MIRARNLHPEVRSRLVGLPRRQWHVCKADAENASYLYNNLESGQLFHEIQDALAVAQAYEDIIVWPGQYKPLATLAITQDSLRLVAAEMPAYGGAQIRTEIRQYGNVDTPCISIEGCHNVEVGGFRITPYDPGTDSVAINVSQTAASYGTYIHRNRFYGVGSGATGPCGVQLGVVDSYNADSTFVYRNEFYLGMAGNDSVAQLMWNCAVHAEVRENNFFCHGNTSAYMGIYIDDAAGMRGGIYDNRFMNIEIGLNGSNGVAISNPAAAGGGCIIDGNHFVNWADDANCIAYMSNDTLGINYNNEAIIASDD